MDEKIVQEILHELFSSLETLDTRSSALLQFMKEKGIAKEEEFAPYLERAGNASSVRWLGARVRIEHLLAGAMKAAEKDEKEKDGKKEAPNATSDRDEAAPPDAGKSGDVDGKPEENKSSEIKGTKEGPAEKKSEDDKETKEDFRAEGDRKKSESG
jgi:hypothetical protein